MALTASPEKAKSRSGSQKRQRVRHIGVCCTDDQFAAIAERARAAGVSRSALALNALLDVPPPRVRKVLPVVNGALLADAIAMLGRANNSANQIARELNTQKFLPDGGIVARATRSQDSGAILAIEAMRRMMETVSADFETAAEAIRRAAGYGDDRRR